MSNLRVSDHAMLRWLERAGGLDIEDLRARLGATLGRAGAAARSMGTIDYLIVIDGLTYVVRDGIVATILLDASSTSKAAALANGGHRK